MQQLSFGHHLCHIYVLPKQANIIMTYDIVKRRFELPSNHNERPTILHVDLDSGQKWIMNISHSAYLYPTEKNKRNLLQLNTQYKCDYIFIESYRENSDYMFHFQMKLVNVLAHDFQRVVFNASLMRYFSLCNAGHFLLQKHTRDVPHNQKYILTFKHLEYRRDFLLRRHYLFFQTFCPSRSHHMVGLTMQFIKMIKNNNSIDEVDISNEIEEVLNNSYISINNVPHFKIVQTNISYLPCDVQIHYRQASEKNALVTGNYEGNPRCRIQVSAATNPLVVKVKDSTNNNKNL